MAQSKHTPGPWFATPTSGTYGHVSTENVEGEDCGGNIATTWGVTGDAGIDARLIAEAGTVAHETGLTPRQLAEQRAELLAALQWALAEIDGRTSYQRPDQKQACNTKARAAIAKAEGDAS